MNFKEWIFTIRWFYVFFVVAIMLLIAFNVWGHGGGKYVKVESKHYKIEHFEPASTDDPTPRYGEEYPDGHGHILLRKDGSTKEWGYWSEGGYEVAKRLSDRLLGFVDYVAPSPKRTPKPKVAPNPEPEPMSTVPQEDIEDDPQTGETGTSTDTVTDVGSGETGNEGEIAPDKPPTPGTRGQPRTIIDRRSQYNRADGYYRVSWTVPRGLSIIHIPLSIEGVTHISDIFELLEHKALYLVALEDQEWVTYYDRYWLYDREDRVFNQSEAFIVVMAEPVILEIVGEALGTELQINEGENLIGIPRKTNVLNLSNTIMLRWSNNEWLYADNHRVLAGEGFIILSNSNSNIYFSGSPWGEPL